MATSSITANFAIHDEKEAKAFVSVLLSDSHSMVPPTRMRNVGLLETERFIAHFSRESAGYTEWRQNQFDDLTIEELGRATRESGKRIQSVLEVDAAVERLLRKN